MARRVVAVSQTTGAGTEDVARAVAERLGFSHVDEEIVATVAERQGLHESVVADVERRRSFLQAFLEGLDTGEPPEAAGIAIAGGYVPTQTVHPRPDYAPLLRELIREAICEAAERGEVVFGSHAASFALADRDDVLRVLVTASPETCARQVAEERGLGEREAGKEVDRSDAGRRDYLKRFYGVERERPTHYDLVVNTDRIGAGGAVELIVAAAQA